MSPVLTAFKWSPIVLAAVEKNLERLGMSSPSRIEGSPKTTSTSVVSSDLVTLHVRRLDYKARKSTSFSLHQMIGLKHTDCDSHAVVRLRMDGWYEVNVFHKLTRNPQLIHLVNWLIFRLG